MMPATRSRKAQVQRFDKPSIALVVPDLAANQEDGLAAVARFLLDTLLESGEYHPELISLALSSRDKDSVRMLSPDSWLHGVRTSDFVWQDCRAYHVGANFVEFEFQRYASRSALMQLLNKYDLVQIIAGYPAWAMIGKHVAAPVTLQVATLAKVERETINRERRPIRGLWSKLMTAITDRMDHRALRYIDHLFVENQWMYDYMSEAVGPERVTFAPPGIDTDVFTPAESFQDSGHILSVGRFGDRRKNVGMLFKAYHALCQTLPEAPPLVLAGSSMPDAEDWRAAEELGIRSRIQVHEDVSSDELAALYRQARMFVLSSNEEGLGIVLLEAMASALPVIATRCGGPETVVDEGENGFLVAVDDYQAMAERMLVLLQGAGLSRQMGRQGRKLILEKYSTEAAGAAFLAVYDELIELSALRKQ